MSASGERCPPEAVAGRAVGSRKDVAMTIKHKKASSGGAEERAPLRQLAPNQRVERRADFAEPAPANATVTLQDVLQVVEGLDALSVTRRRDLRSAVNRVATLLGDDPARIILDIPAISSKLAAIS